MQTRSICPRPNVQYAKNRRASMEERSGWFAVVVAHVNAGENAMKRRNDHRPVPLTAESKNIDLKRRASPEGKATQVYPIGTFWLL
jgi:hypothetical protein